MLGQVKAKIGKRARENGQVWPLMHTPGHRECVNNGKMGHPVLLILLRQLP